MDERLIIADGYIQSLRVDSAKRILRKFNERVTGRKADLLGRIHTLLNTCKATNSHVRLNELRGAILTEVGRPIPGSATTITTAHQPTYTTAYARPPGVPTYPGAVGSSSTSQTTSYPSVNKLYDKVRWKESPFYAIHSHVVGTRLMEPANINGKSYPPYYRSVEFVLTGDQINILNTPKSKEFEYQVYLFCANPPYNPMMSQTVDPAWPYIEGFQLSVNGQYVPSDVIRKLQANKKRTYTGTPCNITNYVRRLPQHVNRVDFRWSMPYNSRWIVSIEIVKVFSIDEIVSQLVSKKMSKESVIELHKAHHKEDDDIEILDQQIKLTDPLIMSKISVPARGRSCRHVQCFDCATFFQFMSSAPSRQCPVCNRVMDWSEIMVDGYFDEILKNVSADVDNVVIKPDFSWSVPVKEEYSSSTQVNAQQSARGSEKSRQSSIPVFDLDDDLEIVAVSRPSASRASSVVGVTAVGSTSNDSSNVRNQSRRSVEVIDLTLDDSDEEVPLAQRAPLIRHRIVLSEPTTTASSTTAVSTSLAVATLTPTTAPSTSTAVTTAPLPHSNALTVTPLAPTVPTNIVPKPGASTVTSTVQLSSVATPATSTPAITGNLASVNSSITAPPTTTIATPALPTVPTNSAPKVSSLPVTLSMDSPSTTTVVTPTTTAPTGHVMLRIPRISDRSESPLMPESFPAAPIPQSARVAIPPPPVPRRAEPTPLPSTTAAPTTMSSRPVSTTTSATQQPAIRAETQQPVSGQPTTQPPTATSSMITTVTTTAQVSPSFGRPSIPIRNYPHAFGMTATTNMVHPSLGPMQFNLGNMAMNMAMGAMPFANFTFGMHNSFGVDPMFNGPMANGDMSMTAGNVPVHPTLRFGLQQQSSTVPPATAQEHASNTNTTNNAVHNNTNDSPRVVSNGLVTVTDESAILAQQATREGSQGEGDEENDSGVRLFGHKRRARAEGYEHEDSEDDWIRSSDRFESPRRAFKRSRVVSGYDEYDESSNSWSDD